MNRNSNRVISWPYLLLTIGVGIVYVVWLCSFVQDEVFFSGDGGLKFLMVKDFASGRISPFLHLKETQGGIELWTKGFYPFGPPFVYNYNGGYSAQYPIYFPLISSVFYKLCGIRGLYIIPAVSLFLSWFCILACLYMLRLHWTTIWIVLAALIFASPLTLYGAMFWEHTLAVFLVSVSCLFLVRIARAQCSRLESILYGVLAGFSVWIRPECLILLGVLLVLSIVMFRMKGLIFVIASVSVVAGFLLLNLLLYHHPLGLHSYQVIHAAFSMKLHVVFLRMLVWLLIEFSPTVLLVAALPLSLRSDRTRELALILIILLVACTFLIPVLIPSPGGKQWGPRFFLIMMPLIALGCGLAWEALWSLRSTCVRIGAVLLFAVSFAIGFHKNSMEGPHMLWRDYHYRILPALQELRNQPIRVVIVSHQEIAQELASILDEKLFLWLRHPDDVPLLESELKRLMISRFLFVTYPDMGQPFNGRVSPIGAFGTYNIFLGRCREAESCQCIDLPLQ